MNARTCQLCGKSLGRLRSEGDFCSKEHKNQYRLRAGMNRLQEANKVANLMRRRENPRQIGAARLICNSDGAARVSDPPKLLASQGEPSTAWPKFSVHGKPHMPDTPQGYQNPAPAGMQMTSNPRRPNSSGIRLGTRQQSPALRQRHMEVPAKLVQARISQLRAPSPQAKPRHRSMDRLPHGKIRVDLGKGPAVLRRKDAIGKFYLHQVVRTCRVRNTPRKGKALRVSTAIGFHVPPAHLRRHQSKATMRSALVWPNKPYSTTPDCVSRPAAPKLLRVDIPTANALCPTGPALSRSSRFVQAKTVAVPSSKPARGARPPAKSSSVEWNPADPRWAGTVPGPESAGFTRRNGAHLFPLSMRTYSIDSLRQFASAPIQVREGPVGYPKVAIQDTLAGAILSPTSLPPAAASLADEDNAPLEVVKAAPVARRYEENFDAGWDNWSGGTADWKVDIAGVRTGPLALFNPSMDMIDYELEFLTRIDHHSVTWVVRAANANEYCRCTLTALPGGELEFSRSTLIDGAAEADVTGGRMAAKPKSALTIRTQVQGQTFTITVNGTALETWTDSRFPIGGVGFIGTPEDRARLYWIRLSSTGSPGKEYRKK